MKLTELIPYSKDSAKWDNLLADLHIDTNCEEVLIYILDKLDTDSDIYLFEIEKSKDDLEITVDGKKYIQVLPALLLQELVTIDFSDLETDAAIAQSLIEYRVNDA